MWRAFLLLLVLLTVAVGSGQGASLPDQDTTLAFTQSLHSKARKPAPVAAKGSDTKLATSAPASYGYETKGADVKHLCLKESKQYNCRFVGCPNVVDCASAASTTATCYDCQTHVIGQSDVACCDKEEEYGDEDADPIFSPALKVGSCDWDMDIYRCEQDPTDNNGRNLNPAQGCTEAIPMENGAYKIGTAWATCYLNADSEYCGHPFCDRMVLTFQGGVYTMEAYATSSGELGPNGVDTDTSHPQGCFPFDAWNDGNGGNNSTRRTSGGSRGGGRRSSMSALNRAIASSGLPKKLAAKYPDLVREAAARTHTPARANYIVQDKQYWHGVAVMFSGAVTVISMDQHVDYSHGMMEYCPWYVGQPLEEGVKPAAHAMLVKPNTYDILLAADNANGDYKGEEYKEEKKDYYKEERKDYGYKKEDREDYYKTEGERSDYYKKMSHEERKGDSYYREGPDRSPDRAPRDRDYGDYRKGGHREHRQ